MNIEMGVFIKNAVVVINIICVCPPLNQNLIPGGEAII